MRVVLGAERGMVANRFFTVRKRKKEEKKGGKGTTITKEPFNALLPLYPTGFEACATHTPLLK